MLVPTDVKRRLALGDDTVRCGGLRDAYIHLPMDVVWEKEDQRVMMESAGDSKVTTSALIGQAIALRSQNQVD